MTGDVIVMKTTSRKPKSGEIGIYHGSQSYVHCTSCICMWVTRRGIIPAGLLLIRLNGNIKCYHQAGERPEYDS